MRFPIPLCSESEDNGSQVTIQDDEDSDGFQVVKPVKAAASARRSRKVATPESPAKNRCVFL